MKLSLQILEQMLRNSQEMGCFFSGLFDEKDHPRAGDGKFTESGQGMFDFGKADNSQEKILDKSKSAGSTAGMENKTTSAENKSKTVEKNSALTAGLMMDMAAYDGGKYARLAYTPEEADRIVKLLRQAGGTGVSASMIGSSSYGPRGYEVWIRSENARSGNMNSFQVEPESGIDMKRAKAIIKETKDKFSGRDKEAFRRQAAVREVDRE